MYGKLFASMYEGTLYGQWQAIITLQQLVILADSDGVVDMTPPAIAARTSIPLEIIEAGLEQLSQADKYSRSDAEEGRRIVPIDPDRPWGWRIVNHAKYRDMRSAEDRKAYMREYMREKRKQEKLTDANSKQSLAQLANTDTDTDTDKKVLAHSGSRNEYPEEFETVWRIYPKRVGGNPKKKALHAWNARIREGHTAEEISEGVQRYVRFCRASGKDGTEFVQQAQTFFGPDKHFLETWQTAPKAHRGFVG